MIRATGTQIQYLVVLWDTGQILLETPHLPSAKRIARNQGHTGKPYGKFYPPVARVDELMQDGSPGYGVLYNPRFVIGKHDDFKPIAFINIKSGERKCSHGLYKGCEKGCN